MEGSEKKTLFFEHMELTEIINAEYVKPGDLVKFNPKSRRYLLVTDSYFKGTDVIIHTSSGAKNICDYRFKVIIKTPRNINS